MILFIIGLLILAIGGYLYGRHLERVFEPDDRVTPAYSQRDDIDYVPMNSWRNQLIELLNIAGTGPILGPIQGILFGPIAFLTIPIGNIFAGAMHDYFVGMISMRNNGAQVPSLVERYLGPNVRKFYNVIIFILLLMTGVVFIYTPGDLIVNDLLGMDVNSKVIYYVYAIILIYYIIATIFPIDQIIGKVYPIFGAFLIVSALGVLSGVFIDGGASLGPITSGRLISEHPLGQQFIPVFFITVACGIMSGFHGSQITLISRTTKSEYEGRRIFYDMMIVEGFIAMAWAAGAMILFNRGTPLDTSATLMVGLISQEFMGKIGGILAVIGVIILPITSGDSSFRALRLIIAEQFDIDQEKIASRITLSITLFIPAIAILFYAKSNADGFNLLWRYFGFTNQLVAVFALAVVVVYLQDHGKNHWIALLPGMFYSFVVMTYIANADIGFRLDSLLNVTDYSASYIVGALSAAFFYFGTHKVAKDRKEEVLRDNYWHTK